VPQKRSILPKVCGCRGAATIWRIPRRSHSCVKALLPRQVWYCVPLSVRTSMGAPKFAIEASKTSRTKAPEALA
jgi:hypothetical protein